MGDTIEFKPCPFCGSTHCTVMSGAVECLICGCRGPHGREIVDRLRGWSIRAIEAGGTPEMNPSGGGNLPRISAACSVKGCTNKRDEGAFVGDFCAPCDTAIRTGRAEHGTSFIFAQQSALWDIAFNKHLPDVVAAMQIAQAVLRATAQNDCEAK